MPVEAFLSCLGWGSAARAPLAGDASARRYERLTRGGDRAVLMIAPPDRGEDIRPFIQVAEHLRSLGLGAPGVFGQDEGAGLLLLEDLGDDLYARVAARDPAAETELYAAAVDVLADLHRHPPPGFAPPYDREPLLDLAGLAWHWYAGERDAQDFRDAMAPLIDATAGITEVLALRDYHAENLVWRPDRLGISRVGLLDFQDAMAGHRAYDLVSLLEDARRDVPDALREAMTARYIAASGTDPTQFRRAFALFGAQRNLRILGVFARLCLRDGKPGYLRLIPRVWGHLMRDLSHSDLSEVRDVVLRDLPPPDNPHLKALEARCAPTP